MKRLRVLHIISTLKAYGAERQVFELLRALGPSDVDVAALAVYDSNLSCEDEDGLGGITESLGRRGRRDYGFMPALVQKIRSFDPDVVHTHTHVGKYWGRPAAWLAGVRAIVHTEHNPCDPRRNALERVLDRVYGGFTDRFVLFFPEQGEMLARLEAIAPSKIVAIPNGLNATTAESGPGARAQARRSLSIAGERLTVMMIGRLEIQKHHQLAFRAFACLDPELRERVDLHIIGAGSTERDLRRLAHELGIAGSVRFAGYRGDATTLLCAADVLLNSSLFEGMPMTFIEAMLANVAIVTTPWLGAANMLDDGALGFVAPDWSEASLAATLSKALLDAQLRAGCVARAAARARNDYTLARTAEAHRQLYNTLALQRCTA
jgi:glycosyltransferase involved in cell wall biosynthesis